MVIELKYRCRKKLTLAILFKYVKLVLSLSPFSLIDPSLCLATAYYLSCFNLGMFFLRYIYIVVLVPYNKRRRVRYYVYLPLCIKMLICSCSLVHFLLILFTISFWTVLLLLLFASLSA